MNIKDIFNSAMSMGTQTSTPPISSFFNKKTVAPVRPAPAKYVLKDRGATITDDDIEAMKPLVYGEVSNRPYNKKELEANVIVNTALNRQKEYARKGQNKTVAEIIAMPNQYQAYGGSEYKNYHNPKDELSMAKRKEVDAIMDSIREKIKKGQYLDNTEGAYYYIHNPDRTIAYDNLKPLFAK